MNPFEPFPVFETPRLILRRIERSDLNAIYQLQSNPRVVEHFGRPPHSRIEQSEELLHKIVDGVQNGTSIRWAITIKPSLEFIGSTGFWRWNQPHFNAEIGYELAPDYWGAGIMVEAIKPTLVFGFDTMKLHRVEANVEPNNKGSVRVLEKLGFQREALLRENWFDGKSFTSTAHYGLLQADLAALS